jgi:choline kinase
MKKEKKIYYTFRIHSEQLEYLRNKAITEFTTVTQYLLDLVSKDMKENNEKQIKSKCNE